MRSCNPAVQARRFRLFRFRSPLLSESRLIYFPPGTEMVHFPGLARTRLYIQRAVSRVHRDGFPHSDIPGSKRACHSPGLIAACHVLLRLLAPRHPPYALSSLTIKLTQHVVFTRLTVGLPSVWINSPFHNLLYSSRTCGFHAAHDTSASQRKVYFTTARVLGKRSPSGNDCASRCQLIQLSKNVGPGLRTAKVRASRSRRDVRNSEPK